MLNYGSRGNSAIIDPIFVNSPSSSNAYKSLNNCNARIRVSGAGGSIKSKCTKSLIPSFNKVKTTLARFERKISGYVSSINSSLNDFSVYNRKHFPGRVLPALPALYLALAFEIGDTNKLSTLIRGLKTYEIAHKYLTEFKNY